METRRQALRWVAALACAAALAACGGGGGGTTANTPPPPPDSRNGTYAMYAGDAREYALSLDFDAKTYHVTGNGQDLSGTIRESSTAGKFDFDPAGTGASAANAPKFTWFNDTVVGGFHLPSGTVPFIAARSFVTTLADAAGTYNYLASVQDTAAASDNYIFTGELLANGTLRTCNDVQIYKISQCPTIVTATVTVSGDHFNADTGSGTYPFRIAKVGSERVFLRASASSGTSRRLQVGIPEAAFVNGSYTGANSRGAGTSTSFTGTTYNATWFDGSANLVVTGTVNTLGTTGPAGIVGITTGTQGNFFAMQDTELLVQMGAHSNPNVPGYVEFGKK